MAVGRTYLLPPLSSGGASLVRPWLRFHTPLIEPDMQISRIQLSDKTSRLHPRRATAGEALEPGTLVAGIYIAPSALEGFRPERDCLHFNAPNWPSARVLTAGAIN